MKRTLAAPNDPLLQKVSQEIPIESITQPETQELIEEMLDVAYDNRIDRTKPTVVGLAAPQVGISKQIILVDIGASKRGGLSNLQVYINPKITWQSEEQDEWCEGCWSTSRVAGAVSRASRIKLEAYTREGKKVIEEHEGYVARIFQHELDHLQGQEFISRIADPEKLHWVEKEEWVEYKANEGWRDWPKKCSREKWEKIKGTTQ
ncbi:MAG: peptide deformylase [Candidatus Levybacteria bacterium]|nr:peptide deformylase [Candidatus Levybacteria bacterium]